MVNPDAIEVTIEIDSYNFWWGVYNLRPSLWEDVTMHIYGANKECKHYATTILTKGFFKCAKAQDSEEYQAKECSPFNKSIDYLIEEKNILFGCYYDDPNDPEFHEVAEIIYERNAQGIRPSYVQIFHPAEQLNLDTVIEAVSKYCIDLLKIKPERVSFKEIMPESEAKRSYDEYLEEDRKSEEFRKQGGKFKMEMPPESLEQLYGTEELFSVGGLKNIQRGYLTDDNKIRIVLKNGSEQDLEDKKFN